ncbi:MAG: cytochrome d ubiquinol oxidase subunit II [Methylomonas sp.]|nr:cytochrome d ubiquinol oxidase subunit II [Methylomonas sp.]
MTLDLESLRLIWWALLGIVMIGFVLCEGLTLGVALLLPMVAKADAVKRLLIRGIIEPLCLGHSVWLITFVAVLFAVWPTAYAVSLACFYGLVFLILLALLIRPLALHYLGEADNNRWRQQGYRMLSVGAWLSTVLFGIAIGNVLKGVPFHLESDMHIRFLGDVFGLFNLFSLLVAATCLAMLAMHGAVFLQLKTEGELQCGAKGLAVRAGLLFLIGFTASGLWITHLEGYHVNSEILTQAASNPLSKFVKRGEGLWLDNFEHEPALWVVPVLAFIAGIAATVLALRDKPYWAMLASSTCLTMVVLTFGVSMFPFLLPSNISLNSSLTIWDSSASQLSLEVLLWVAVFALPLQAIYSRWQFRRLSNKPELSE